MRIRYSTPDAYGVLYMELRAGEYAESIPMEDDMLVVDVDAHGRTLGVEILDVAGFLERVKCHGGAFEIPDHVDLTASPEPAVGPHGVGTLIDGVHDDCL